jgi:4-alpha-glucanotransferase
LNVAGQDWGLPPFDPRALRQSGYRGFIDLLRANMRHAGGLRIDHVMALQRLYLIPEGQQATAGAYVSYPLDDLVGLLALESQRNRCLVVGEDLGTVPEGFRERMEKARVLSYRVVFFEVQGDEFVQPDRYPHLALATVGSHDLATLRGWWQENDIDLKSGLGLYPEGGERDQRAHRSREREALIRALERRGFPSRGVSEPNSDAPPNLSDAVHHFLADTRAGLAMVQVDDLADELVQVNLPGTSFEHPNWRRKLSLTLEELNQDPRVRRIAAIMNSVRRTTPRP